MVHRAPETPSIELADPATLPQGSELDILSTPEKLQVLLDDQRANFVPSTHREKTQASYLLDYLDNPHFRGGVHDYLAEIYTHNKKLKHSRLAGSIAVRSVLYEFADYRTAARNDFQSLKQLETAITAAPNPHLSLSEAIADENLDTECCVPFIRYIDVRGVTTGNYRGAHDPLITKEYRRAPGHGRQKIVHDTYDVQDRDLFIATYLVERAETITIGESRVLIEPAVSSQEHREAFWTRILGSRMYEYQHFADEARAATQ